MELLHDPFPASLPSSLSPSLLSPVVLGKCLWLAVEALPAQALRRLPPVPAVAAADGAVVHLHFNAGRDDRCSSKAIWTCHTGEKREKETEKRRTENWQRREKERKQKKRQKCSREAPLGGDGMGATGRGPGGVGAEERDLFMGMHRWACFCNTKALSPSLPSLSLLTQNTLHSNAQQAEDAGKEPRWRGHWARALNLLSEAGGSWCYSH